ncbi:MAG TPA: hypothetical protein VMF13_00880 [Luteitalea sp.]|nr:hypothetical protein [Luteitalea sp.]
MTMFRSVIAGLTICLAAGPSMASAQSHDQHAHGGAPTERLGTVHFATSCATATRDAFDKGVALLHSFWYSAAIRTFEEVWKADPTCVMAQWGMAMSWWGNPFAASRSTQSVEHGRAALAAARASGAGTDREKAYLAAVAHLFAEGTMPAHARLVAYEQAMGELAARHPDDVEARIFHGLSLAQSALPTDKTYANQLKAAAILEKEFARQPEHPGLAHYIIHSLDVPPLAPRALDAARRYARIAPDAPHALHMPSHTFTRVGSWQESVETNLASAAAARKDKAPAEELHALDYQAYAYLQMAQDAAARRTVDAIPALAAGLPNMGAGNAAPPAAGYYALAAIPARYALEREAWADAAALPVTSSPFGWADAVTHFARALGAARLGQVDAAQADVAALGAIATRLKTAGDAYWSGQVDIQRRAASAWVSFAQGQTDAAVAALGEAAAMEDATEKAAVTPGPIKPARELLGDMLMAARRPADAQVAYEATLTKEPRRFRATWGAARAATAAQHTDAARAHYAALLEIAGTADQPARAELVEARRVSR